MQDFSDFAYGSGVSSVLERIARQYPEDSEEYKAILLASEALVFISRENQMARFEEFKRTYQQELTSFEKARLREIGIEPDSKSM